MRIAIDLLEDRITWMEEKGYSPGYTEGFIKTIKSWLGHFDVEIKRRLKVRNAGYTPTLQNERVPDGQEISEVFSRASLRASVMISLMSKSGLRPEVLGNHDGTDGLQMRDLPDIVIHQGMTKCIRTLNQVIVRRELSKAKHQYFTFLTSSGTKKLIAYLNDRLACGKSLHGNSPVVAPDHIHKLNRGKNNGKAFLPTRQISKEIRHTFRPRFQWRPYVLRAYFDTELLIAESKGKIAHDFRVFFMGHKGSMEARYTTNKGYAPRDTSPRDARCLQALRRVPRLGDIKRGSDTGTKGGHATDNTRCDTRGARLHTRDVSVYEHRQYGGPRQTVVTSDRAEQMILRGWMFAGTLPNGKVVLEKGT